MSWSTSANNLADWTSHETLREWILDRIRLLRPARVHLCDGSQQEHDELLTHMVHSGTLVRLNERLRPNSYVARSTASDVARIEERTFICSENKSDAGFTNNWKDPEEMLTKLNKLFDGCMKGRTMYDRKHTHSHHVPISITLRTTLCSAWVLTLCGCLGVCSLFVTGM